jgi:hypothetical protein
MVMDDSAVNIPGGGGIYWKGHKAVSNACRYFSHLSFDNVLNVGHNRIFKKIK